MNLLSLDDSRIVQTLLSTGFKSSPEHHVDITGTAPEALEQLLHFKPQGKRYDCLLLDMNCPGFVEEPAGQKYGGIQLVSILRKDPRHEALKMLGVKVADAYTRVPILMFTTETSAILHNKALGDGEKRYGANRVLNKKDFLSSPSLLNLKKVIAETILDMHRIPA